MLLADLLLTTPTTVQCQQASSQTLSADSGQRQVHDVDRGLSMAWRFAASPSMNVPRLARQFVPILGACRGSRPPSAQMIYCYMREATS